MTNAVVRSKLISRPVALVAGLSLLLGAGAVTSASAVTVSALPRDQSVTAPLANMDHLNFLLDDVPLLPVEGHTTYQIATQPTAQAPWVYADNKGGGVYSRVGGGDLDPATGHYGQGAFDSDDIARTAVVYLRHWKQTGSLASREHAFQTLRSLTYLQTSSGPNAGNVVRVERALTVVTRGRVQVSAAHARVGATTPVVRVDPWGLRGGHRLDLVRGVSGNREQRDAVQQEVQVIHVGQRRSRRRPAGWCGCWGDCRSRCHRTDSQKQ